MSIQQCREDLAEALRGIEGMQADTELGASLYPPACGFGPARFVWRLGTSEPTDATMVIGLVVSDNKGPRVYDDMIEWLPRVAEAIESLPDAVIRSASPGTWPSGGADLPAYLFEVEVALPWR